MKITIFSVIVALVLYFILVGVIKNWVHGKVVDATRKDDKDGLGDRLSYKKDDYGQGHSWTPTYKLKHNAFKAFNIPFVPEEKEIFYIENEYDEDANIFVRDNIKLIKELLSTRGLTFVYLPMVKVPRKMIAQMVEYYSPGLSGVGRSVDYDEESAVKSCWLLDYMVYPQNRGNITSGFCWYNTSCSVMQFKKVWHVFDYISFDGTEAKLHPREVLEEMLPELGLHKRWKHGVYCEVSVESNGLADDNFDEETKKILTDIQKKLNAVRMKGISEAIIAQYVKPCPKLSRITISRDFTITLNDYNNMVIEMGPVVKAVFILFLRHRDGIMFKDLSDYQTELEIIYRAVKARKNDVDEKLRSGFTPQISDSVRNLTDPCNNSINEKCTRIKEAFIIHFHDSIASNYYIQGVRASEKMIRLPRKLVIWEK